MDMQVQIVRFAENASRRLSRGISSMPVDAAIHSSTKMPSLLQCPLPASSRYLQPGITRCRVVARWH